MWNKRRFGVWIGVAALLMLISTRAALSIEIENSATTVNANKPTIKKDVLVTFVELGSINCIPCKMMQPIMAEIEKQYGNQVKVIFYDVWTAAGKPYAGKYQIRAIPTQVFLDKNGKEYFRHMGFFPKEEIVKVLKKQGVK